MDRLEELIHELASEKARKGPFVKVLNGECGFIFVFAARMEMSGDGVVQI